MKYLALLSGGKDSCYNLVHCAQNGHELVAAASLGPEPGKEELDSYLYQTVGQDAIEFVARALDVPLYRRVITGTAVEQGSEYGGRSANHKNGIEGDETEDLFELLSTVKHHHPDVKGVSVGAILSNYQRVRIEHVCRRLDLITLCFLWQRNQRELLHEMIDAGMEAVLIKVAGIGLTKSHLGKSLAEMENTLIKLNNLYGSHICGEGGEYETLTLDCPLFKHRINLTDTEIVIHADNDFATVAFLRIKEAELQKKPPQARIALIPPILDDKYKAIKHAPLHFHPDIETQRPDISSQKFCHPSWSRHAQSYKGSYASVSNVQVDPAAHNNYTIEEEVKKCFHILSDCLAEKGLTLSQIASINVFISSMDLFLPVNTVYATFFGTSPPARACVGVDLPEGTRIRLDCIAFTERNSLDRQALHVQGLSYWAPANIGPYSQAIMAGERIFISGQIGLIPSSLSLPMPRCLSQELALACQHIARVTLALKENSGGGWEGHTQLSIFWATRIDDLPYIKQGHNCLQTPRAPLIFLVVKELPKGAFVEKQVLLHSGRCQVIDDYDGELVVENMAPDFEEGSREYGDGCVVHWEVSWFKANNASCAVIYLKGDFSDKMMRLGDICAAMPSILESTITVRYFYCPGVNDTMDTLASSIFGGSSLPPITPVPCRAISNSTSDNWDLAFCIIGESDIL
ncbi:hypothetical protein M413DRAFT_441121 [Hebeloma cylindrosporum]|uniref:Diphthine--ammonia ligase n=1 Tax=Hebeloma cylindrosporum TaxID=76867 RepID=A0A0C3CPM6_HEBCY|nr:hypothetical protein M413DRAFT_441121 [Hebeloma cylindrosporum h7]